MPRHSILTICAFAAWILSGTNYAWSAPVAGTQSADGQTITSGANVTDVSVFYPYLAPYGKWFTLGSYGLVWSPAGVGAGWSPYANGSWVYTDDGWTWVSDDPWGWATCHYGRWLLDQAYGWVWIPGTEWAPAWVDWRMGDGYIGWAPLPPDATWDPSSGLAEVDIPAGCYSFVVEREFVTEHIKRKILLPDRNATLIKVTIRVTEYDYVNGVLSGSRPS